MPVAFRQDKIYLCTPNLKPPKEFESPCTRFYKALLGLLLIRFSAGHVFMWITVCRLCVFRSACTCVDDRLPGGLALCTVGRAFFVTPCNFRTRSRTSQQHSQAAADPRECRSPTTRLLGTPKPSTIGMCAERSVSAQTRRTSCVHTRVATVVCGRRIHLIYTILLAEMCMFVN